MAAWLAAWAVAASAGAATPPDGPPPPGTYAGRLCVVPLQADAGNCGPANLLLQRGNRATVRVADIVYRLQLNSSQVDVVLMHGAVQVDAFTSSYDWAGSTLRFADREKGLRYEVYFQSKE